MSSGPSNSAVATPSMSVRAMPWVFVLIWSTGFIVARFGMPYVPPLHFLSIRYALTLLCFGLWVALAKVAWPSSRVQWGHLAVTGFLMQAGYLGGVWSAVRAGMGAALVALLVGLQPVLTALWLAYRGGAPSRRHRSPTPGDPRAPSPARPPTAVGPRGDAAPMSVRADRHRPLTTRRTSPTTRRSAVG